MSTKFSRYSYHGAQGIERIDWVQYKPKGFLAAGKGQFVGDLKLDYVDGHEWKLLEPFSYVSQLGNVYTAETGMLTDFASIPQFLWSVLPPTSQYGPAAVIHDKLCGTKGFSRTVADDLFYEMLTVLEVPKWQRWVLYRGVRIGAWWNGVKSFFFDKG